MFYVEKYLKKTKIFVDYILLSTDSELVIKVKVEKVFKSEGEKKLKFQTFLL